MKKNFSLLLSIFLITMLFCSCGANAAQASASSSSAATETASPSPTPLATASPTPEPEDKTVSLSIARSTKGYNPYLFSDTVVEQTASLLFENFITISEHFTLEYRLARKITSEGTAVTITLRSDCLFADGTPITPQDALASFWAAKQSQSYAARFQNVTDAVATEQGLLLTLASPDSLFAYLLDIPILKETDIANLRPTASGRYTYTADDTAFIPNPHAPFADGSDITISLAPVSGYDEMISKLAIGEINYSILGENSAGTSSSISSAEHYYKTNTILFLGVNSYTENPLCNTSTGRQLLSKTIDRNGLTTGSYSARAYPARGVLNPFYPCVKDAQTILPEQDTTAFAETMQALGYLYNDETGFFELENGTRAHVSILTHAGNSYKSQLASLLSREWNKLGIETTVTTAPDFHSFLTFLQTNEFELYIGEMKLYNNIELSPFWSGSAKYGIALSEPLRAAYQAFRADASTAANFESAFSSEMPYIPLLWRNGIVVTNRSMRGLAPSLSDPFYSLEGLTIIHSS